MKRRLIFLYLLLCSCYAHAANYFIEFAASKGVPAFSIEMDGILLGPLPVSKFGSASFGPIASPVPKLATARWKTDKGDSREETIVFGDKEPTDFKALKFFVEESGRLTVSYVVRMGGYRTLDIPLNESPEATSLRELNESLYIAAGRGQLSTVQEKLKSGADINYLFGSIYPSPVRYAANGKHRDVVDYLLSQGARVTKRDLVAPLLLDRTKELGRKAE